MVVDTSALVAILQDEPERGDLTRILDESESVVMSVVSFAEASLVIESRYGPDGRRDLDLLVSKALIELVPVDIQQAYIARDAFRRFGKGRHPARLNFGDCFAYALAKSLGEPLLCKGHDFALSDVDIVPGIRR